MITSKSCPTLISQLTRTLLYLCTAATTTTAPWWCVLVPRWFLHFLVVFPSVPLDLGWLSKLGWQATLVVPATHIRAYMDGPQRTFCMQVSMCHPPVRHWTKLLPKRSNITFNTQHGNRRLPCLPYCHSHVRLSLTALPVTTPYYHSLTGHYYPSYPCLI